MFGHHDDTNQPQDNDAAAEPVQETPPAGESETAEATEQPAQNGTDTQDQATVQTDPLAPAPAEPDAASAHDGTQDDAQDPAWQHPGTPLDDKGQISDVISPAGGFPKRPSYHYPSGTPAPDAPDTDEVDPADRELIDVKEHALDELAPLLDKLDLPPEEKFRAIMMILQANDDKGLVKAAYAVAHSIEDDETRARALYTIVNEVDYFTHPPENQ